MFDMRRLMIKADVSEASIWRSRSFMLKSPLTDGMIVTAQSSMSFRTALIPAAVMGKIDVREEVA